MRKPWPFFCAGWVAASEKGFGQPVGNTWWTGVAWRSLSRRLEDRPRKETIEFHGACSE
jgi:hypothetical protein